MRASATETSTDLRRARRLDVIAYVAVALVAIAIGGHLLDFWAQGISTPSNYAGDSLLTSMSIKGIIDNGQHYTNPYLAAPGEAELFDFPGADGFFLLELWVLSLFTSDFAVVLNVWVWLGYPLIALAAMWALRRMGLGRPSSAVFALLYACIPFHQVRINGHQSLSLFFVIPLAIALIVTVILDLRPHDERPRRRRFLGIPLWGWFVVLLLGSCGVYYAYFGIVLAFVAGVVAAWATRDVRRLVPALAVVAATAAIVVAQVVPSYVYWSQQGANSLAEFRNPISADFFGLRMTNLVFPTLGHRFAPFAEAKEYLRQSFGLISETSLGIAYDSSLGLVGTGGFVLLLFWILTAAFRPPSKSKEAIPAKLALLGTTAFLLATVGGVGAVVAYLGFPQIRAYDRITPYIAFISLAAGAWLVDAVIKRMLGREGRLSHTARTAIVVGCLGLLLVFGLWDQTTPVTTPDYATIRPSFESDRAFVGEVEASLPTGSMVFQVPYVSFPEGVPVEGTSAYDPLRMYLHSESTHWSAAAFMERSDAKWQKRVAGLAVPAMTAALVDAGFRGIVVDRDGYEDAGAAIEADISSGSSGEPIVSPDGRFAFYRLDG